MSLVSYLEFSDEVDYALKHKNPVVALESTIIAHGMPFPSNLETAKSLEGILRDAGVTPATIALMDGKVKVGLSNQELDYLSQAKKVEKISRRDFARCLSSKSLGATTVAATLMAAQMAGIRVFATGGIGGVHRKVANSWDISADLRELSLASVVCVSAGVKSILDIPKTLETLETLGVPVRTLNSKYFPAFYSSKSSELSPLNISDVSELASEFKVRLDLGIEGGVLLAVPIPEEYSQDYEKMEGLVSSALNEAENRGILGKEITPFLLEYISKKSSGESLKANIALVKNNVKIAAEVAKNLSH